MYSNNKIKLFVERLSMKAEDLAKMSDLSKHHLMSTLRKWTIVCVFPACFHAENSHFASFCFVENVYGIVLYKNKNKILLNVLKKETRKKNQQQACIGHYATNTSYARIKCSNDRLAAIHFQCLLHIRTHSSAERTHTMCNSMYSESEWKKGRVSDKIRHQITIDSFKFNLFSHRFHSNFFHFVRYFSSTFSLTHLSPLLSISGYQDYIYPEQPFWLDAIHFA